MRIWNVPEAARTIIFYQNLLYQSRGHIDGRRNHVFLRKPTTIHSHVAKFLLLSTFKHGHFCFMFELKFISIQFWKLFIFNKSCFHCATRWQSMCKSSMSLKTDLISIQLLMCLNVKLWSIIYFPMERQINKKNIEIWEFVMDSLGSSNIISLVICMYISID